MRKRIAMILAVVMLSISSMIGKGGWGASVLHERDSLAYEPLQPLSSAASDQFKPITPLSQRNTLHPFGDIIDHQDMTPTFQNVFDMIQGRVPGVQVSGGYMSYRIRVRGSLWPPLVVLDGMPLYSYDDRSLNDLLLSIAPADVDYIEVVKNIAQINLYGPGAGNGVIMVYTKRGEMIEEVE